MSVCMCFDFIYFIIIVNVINLDGMHEHAFHLVYWAFHQIPLDETPIDVIVEYEDVWVSYITYTLHEHIVGGMFPETLNS